MDRHIPRPGERYLHFKGKQYQVLCIATHSESKEQMVVYQALYGDYKCYVRPLWMFMSAVDRAKYPNAEQNYRFEPVVLEETAKEETVADLAKQQEEGEADPVLLRFLDADTLEEKYQLLKQLGNSISDRLIDDFAAALDLVIPEGDLDARYFQLLNSVRTMQRFENNRFR